MISALTTRSHFTWYFSQQCSLLYAIPGRRGCTIQHFMFCVWDGIWLMSWWGWKCCVSVIKNIVCWLDCHWITLKTLCGHRIVTLKTLCWLDCYSENIVWPPDCYSESIVLIGLLLWKHYADWIVSLKTLCWLDCYYENIVLIGLLL